MLVSILILRGQGEDFSGDHLAEKERKKERKGKKAKERATERTESEGERERERERLCCQLGSQIGAPTSSLHSPNMNGGRDRGRWEGRSHPGGGGWGRAGGQNKARRLETNRCVDGTANTVTLQDGSDRVTVRAELAAGVQPLIALMPRTITVTSLYIYIYISKYMPLCWIVFPLYYRPLRGTSTCLNYKASSFPV